MSAAHIYNQEQDLVNMDYCVSAVNELRKDEGMEKNTFLKNYTDKLKKSRSRSNRSGQVDERRLLAQVRLTKLSTIAGVQQQERHKKSKSEAFPTGCQRRASII